MPNEPASSPSLAAAGLKARMADVMRHTEALASVLPTAYALPDVTRRTLRPLRDDLNHALAQILRVLAPLPESTLWAADLKYRIGILERDVDEAVAATKARHEAWQKYYAVRYNPAVAASNVPSAASAEAYDADVKLGELNREAYSTCGNLAVQIKQSADAVWMEVEKAQAAMNALAESAANRSAAGYSGIAPAEKTCAIGTDGATICKGNKEPTQYLLSWREILTTVNRNVNEEEQRRVRSLNEKFDGPIHFPGRGHQPKVAKGKLLDWWNHLEIQFKDQENQEEGAKEDAATHHNYGRNGAVAPEIGGGVRRRRSDRKPQ